MPLYQNKKLYIKREELTQNKIQIGDLVINDDGHDMGMTVSINGKHLCYFNEAGAVFLSEWLKNRKTIVEEVVITDNYKVTES